uniref:SAM domain-containing protein n=1 Tax=Rhabditophanes sp. KR3021 TaxID=114890 RepID=A0AC35UBN0_9BILA
MAEFEKGSASDIFYNNNRELNDNTPRTTSTPSIESLRSIAISNDVQSSSSTPTIANSETSVTNSEIQNEIRQDRDSHFVNKAPSKVTNFTVTPAQDQSSQYVNVQPNTLIYNGLQYTLDSQAQGTETQNSCSMLNSISSTPISNAAQSNTIPKTKKATSRKTSNDCSNYNSLPSCAKKTNDLLAPKDKPLKEREVSHKFNPSLSSTPRHEQNITDTQEYEDSHPKYSDSSKNMAGDRRNRERFISDKRIEKPKEEQSTESRSIFVRKRFSHSLEVPSLHGKKSKLETSSVICTKNDTAKTDANGAAPRKSLTAADLKNLKIGKLNDDKKWNQTDDNMEGMSDDSPRTDHKMKVKNQMTAIQNQSTTISLLKKKAHTDSRQDSKTTIHDAVPSYKSAKSMEPSRMEQSRLEPSKSGKKMIQDSRGASSDYYKNGFPPKRDKVDEKKQIYERNYMTNFNYGAEKNSSIEEEELGNSPAHNVSSIKEPLRKVSYSNKYSNPLSNPSKVLTNVMPGVLNFKTTLDINKFTKVVRDSTDYVIQQSNTTSERVNDVHSTPDHLSKFDNSEDFLDKDSIDSPSKRVSNLKETGKFGNFSKFTTKIMKKGLPGCIQRKGSKSHLIPSLHIGEDCDISPINASKMPCHSDDSPGHDPHNESSGVITPTKNLENYDRIVMEDGSCFFDDNTNPFPDHNSPDDYGTNGEFDNDAEDYEPSSF